MIYLKEITQPPKINRNTYNKARLVVCIAPPANRIISHIKNVIEKSINVETIHAIFSDDFSKPIILINYNLKRIKNI